MLSGGGRYTVDAVGISDIRGACEMAVVEAGILQWEGWRSLDAQSTVLGRLLLLSKRICMPIGELDVLREVLREGILDIDEPEDA